MSLSLLNCCLGASQPASGVETVVLVHGMGRTWRSMTVLGRHLEREGYRVVNFGYPSTRQPIETSVSQLRRCVANAGVETSGKVHFVTHSLGGILVRSYLKQHRPTALGRVVMLAPPNQGSEVADRLRNNWVYRWATGPAGQSLGTTLDSVPNQLGPVDFEVGVVAGNRSFNPLFSAWLRGPSDGKVSVKRSQVDGMADFVVVPSGHTFIMNRRDVKAHVVRFLRCGEFQHTGA